MARIKPLLLLLSSVALAASLSAQSDQGSASTHVKVLPVPIGVDEAAGGHVKTLPAPGLTPSGSPFALDNAKADAGRSIRVVPEDQMSRNDRDLVADAESSIEERAGFENLAFNGAGWTYRQLVCPALPNHLFLRFTRDDDTRQMSMFSAAIPRNGNGRVHIIPIVRKGYSLFSPAPIGAMTIAAFNRIRAEEGEGASADWLGTGLCYAALAGANPQAGESASGADDHGETPITSPPILRITSQGGAVIQFADVSASPKPMEWNMIFDARGKLLKATHAPAYVMRVGKPIPGPVDVGEDKR